MLHLKVYMHILNLEERAFFDTSAEEGRVKVWEPNECKPVSYSDQFLPGD